MQRIPIGQVIGIFVGSSVVLGLLVLRGFVLSEHARIMLGALALIGLVGNGWNLAAAVEHAGGWRNLGVGAALLIVALTTLAAFAPALLLGLWGLVQAR